MTLYLRPTSSDEERIKRAGIEAYKKNLHASVSTVANLVHSLYLRPPRDEERIKRAQKSKSGEKSRDNNSGRRRRGKVEKDDLGHPMMKNKHGALVVDQKKLKASQDKTEKSDKPAVSKKALQQVENKLKKIEASLTASASVSDSSSNSTRAPAAPAEVTKQVHEVRTLLAALTNEE